jgi:hypothetical protein
VLISRSLNQLTVNPSLPGFGVLSRRTHLLIKSVFLPAGILAHVELSWPVFDIRAICSITLGKELGCFKS